MKGMSARCGDAGHSGQYGQGIAAAMGVSFPSVHVWPLEAHRTGEVPKDLIPGCSFSRVLSHVCLAYYYAWLTATSRV